MEILIETVRSQYKNKIEYDYDFSNLICVLLSAMNHTNLVPRAIFSTGQQQREVTLQGT